MGILGNLFMAGVVHHHNHTRDGISRRLLGFIPDTGNIVICGGDTTLEDSIASELKHDSLIDNIIQAVEDNKPAVCIYSEDSLTPEILDLLNDDKFKEKIWQHRTIAKA